MRDKPNTATPLARLLAAWQAAHDRTSALLLRQDRLVDQDAKLALEPDIAAAFQEQVTLEKHIIATPATDFPGPLGKLDIALSFLRDDAEEPPWQLVESARRDLQALTAAQAAAGRGAAS